MKTKRFFKNFLWILAGLMLSGCQKETMELSWETEEETPYRETETQQKQTEETVLVHVCGAVKSPGVYELPASSRIIDAVSAAGGCLADAAPDEINLAQKLQDGDQIRILTKEQAQSQGYPEAQEETLDLNRADKAQLMELPGIGEAKAEAILAYREEVGRFQTIEELKNVSGIKESIFEKIKDKIMVR